MVLLQGEGLFISSMEASLPVEMNFKRDKNLLMQLEHSMKKFAEKNFRRLKLIQSIWGNCLMRC